MAHSITMAYSPLALATTSSLGSVICGSGLAVSVGGILSATGGGSSQVGAWIPSVVDNTAGIIVVVPSNASFVKTGQLVVCTFDFTVAAISGGVPTSTLSLHGLPFTSITGTSYAGSGYCSFFNGLSPNGQGSSSLTFSVNSNSTTAVMWATEPPGETETLNYNDIAIGTRLVGTISYISAT